MSMAAERCLVHNPLVSGKHAGLGLAVSVPMSVCVCEHNAFSTLLLWQLVTSHVSARLCPELLRGVLSKLSAVPWAWLSHCTSLAQGFQVQDISRGPSRHSLCGPHAAGV